MSEELTEFVRSALAQKIARPEISDALAKAGWAESDIRSALGAYAEVSFPLPVPRPKPYLSAKEVFIYVIMFCSLYDSCYQIGSIIFEFINQAFPDAAPYYGNHYSQDAIRWSIAHLTIALPLFLFTFHSTNKAITVNPVLRNSRPRKWLTYLTLLIATLSLSCDLGTLVYNLLNGGLTVHFILKVITVAVIAGGTFLYFLHDVRKEEMA
jgi:hypothetical protein